MVAVVVAECVAVATVAAEWMVEVVEVKRRDLRNWCTFHTAGVWRGFLLRLEVLRSEEEDRVSGRE